ncbi:MAG: superoxide dismutase [Ni] [bacterium]|jgi:nickel superoxide dismutase|nr:superoxide dismutase [Ni] [bacterium]
MNKKWIAGFTVVAVLSVFSIYSVNTFSHCQIPCGIFGDDLRFSLLAEHLVTIEKSMKQIEELSAGDTAKNTNQIVRWVQNKENHADEFTEIVTAYFMAQRVKPADESDAAAFKAYTQQIILLHKMVVGATKCKQTTDVAHVEAMEKLVEEFHALYTAK